MNIDEEGYSPLSTSSVLCPLAPSISDFIYTTEWLWTNESMYKNAHKFLNFFSIEWKFEHNVLEMIHLQLKKNE